MFALFDRMLGVLFAHGFGRCGVVGGLPESESFDQQPVIACVEFFGLREVTAELRHHLRVSGVGQPFREKQGLGGVETAVVGAGGGEVRMAVFQQALGGLKRASRLHKEIFEDLLSVAHPGAGETMAPSLRALIRYGSEEAWYSSILTGIRESTRSASKARVATTPEERRISLPTSTGPSRSNSRSTSLPSSASPRTWEP